MDASQLLTVAGVVLGIVTTLASATAILFSTRAKVTIEGLRGDAVDYERRIGRLEADVTRLTAENKALRAENQTLRSMKDATHATNAVERLAELLESQDKRRAGEHHDILASVHASAASAVVQHDALVELIGGKP